MCVYRVGTDPREDRPKGGVQGVVRQNRDQGRGPGVWEAVIQNLNVNLQRRNGSRVSIQWVEKETGIHRRDGSMGGVQRSGIQNNDRSTLGVQG